MARPVIALLSDFGLRDHYVAAMKGVMLAVCPDATLVDLSHDVPPHDVRAGARLLASCYAYFPAGTVFVAVVDPGVGSTRRGLAADVGDYRLVGPDNGLLSTVFAERPPARLVELSERKYARPTISRTFEGRDRFAPAAAWLAKGVALTSLGRSLVDYVRLEATAPVESTDGLTGVVEHVDRFGNLVTNLGRSHVERLARAGAIDVRIAGHRVPRLVATYSEALPGELCALFGSTEHLEVAVNGGRAAEQLQAGVGSPVEVRRSGL
jgi:S-adenosyl-L-methionine hydrolase (adenosine-forming)